MENSDFTLSYPWVETIAHIWYDFVFYGNAVENI